MRKACAILFSVFLASLITLSLDIPPARAGVIVVPDDYPSIQAAINAANEGDTVFVRNGTYYEHVVVDKTLSLIGEGSNTTIIDGNMTGNVVWITQDHVNIRGFTIQRSGRASFNSGISISSTKHCDISANRIVDNEFGVYGSPRNTNIVNNTIGDNHVGVAIDPGATGNVISGNHLVANTVSVHLYYADSNHIFQNNMMNNWRSVTLWYSMNNRLYHNNFLNNTEKIRVFPYANFLDNGCEGNYWSEYNVTDLNHDGIGDVPYIIDANNTDNYPLMGPFHSFNTSLGKHVNVISDSAINEFDYFEHNNTIRMYVSKMTTRQTHGFCRLSIPHDLMFEPFNVTINGVNPTYWNYSLSDNGTHRWIYFSYQHSALEIVIIPEFPSLIILPLFMITTLLTVIVHRRKDHILS